MSNFGGVKPTLLCFAVFELGIWSTNRDIHEVGKTQGVQRMFIENICEIFKHSFDLHLCQKPLNPSNPSFWFSRFPPSLVHIVKFFLWISSLKPNYGFCLWHYIFSFGSSFSKKKNPISIMKGSLERNQFKLLFGFFNSCCNHLVANYF